MNCINLNENSIKILGDHYSYDQASENDANFANQINSIENILKMWRFNTLNLEGKITVFKTLAFAKIIRLALVKAISTTTVEQLTKRQKDFL